MGGNSRVHIMQASAPLLNGREMGNANCKYLTRQRNVDYYRLSTKSMHIYAQ